MLPPPARGTAGTVSVMPAPVPGPRIPDTRRGVVPSDGMAATGRRPAGRRGGPPVQDAENVIELVGHTPLVRLTSVTRELGPDAPLVLAKVEYLNPGGSVKDRIAVRMVDAAEASGALRPGGTIVEPTSGNTGIGLALVAQQRGYRCVFV